MSLILHLGLDFDNTVYTQPASARSGLVFAGPRKLLGWMESQLGLGGYPENTDYLRIELYRQSMAQWADTTPDLPFYAASFEADRFATAMALLAFRDELLLSGWNFQPETQMPARLADLAGVEAIYQLKINNPEAGVTAMGVSDRCAQALHWLETRALKLEKVVLHEHEALQPAFVQRAVAIFRQKNIPVETLEPLAQAPPETDLGHLQRRLMGIGGEKKEAANDGSLLVLRARRDSDAAVFLAQWLARNPEWRPVFLLPELNRLLEQALLLEQFPALGGLSASLARPSLQVLKLAPAFLWEPVDVYKIMEFVTLPVKPLDDGLALEIARVLAQKPGLFSDTWYAAVLSYLEQGELPARVRDQYDFWFDRRRYRADGTAPKRDALELYAYLRRWALDTVEESKTPALLVLAEQARRICELLDALPEQRLSFLELERIIRTIYEPSPVQLAPPETGRFEFVNHSGAIADPVGVLVWWNCLFDGAVPPPDHWQQLERNWLAARHVNLDDPVTAGRRRLFLNQRPVLQTSRRLVLVIPEQADGSESNPSLLLSDIETAFNQINGFTFRLDIDSERRALERWGVLPQQELLENRPLQRPRPQLFIPQPERLDASEYETPTNLESLFYYPHRWFFRQKLRLFPSSLLSVTRDQTLLGSLAHRFFELLLQEKNCLDWDKTTVRNWIDAKAETLLEREGATLLLYGREPERNQFLSRVKNAAWSLLSMIRTDGWEVADTELALEGSFGGGAVQGKADLVLRRGAGEWAIVDLKWSGARRRKEMIQNGEDLQLVLYARLLPPPDNWAHTAYFILEDGKMISRNKAAFRDAIVAGAGDPHAEACQQIFDRMERTYAWRRAQLEKGVLELRTARTAPELDALYAESLVDLLEMKTEDARWDDYRTLLEMG